MNPRVICFFETEGVHDNLFIILKTKEVLSMIMLRNCGRFLSIWLRNNFFLEATLQIIFLDKGHAGLYIHMIPTTEITNLNFLLLEL